jgi:hypothetical protein
VGDEARLWWRRCDAVSSVLCVSMLLSKGEGREGRSEGGRRAGSRKRRLLAGGSASGMMELKAGPKQLLGRVKLS